MFAGYVSWLGAVEVNGKFNIEYEKGNAEVSVTHEDDIGGASTARSLDRKPLTDSKDSLHTS